jgi:hypothetical protein
MPAVKIYRVLILVAGKVYNTRLLAQQGAQLTAIDISEILSKKQKMQKATNH